MLPYIFGGIALVLFALVVFIATRPGTTTITRTATMAAPPSAVFEQLNDLHLWNAWSPWAKLDPNATETHSGSPKGVGAIMEWNGNKNVGAGRMTIVESRPAEYLQLKLEFLRPMRAINKSEFTLKPEGPGTHVNWTMTCTNGFMGKAFCLVMNMDKMIGGDFEKGLASIRGIVEAKS